MPIYVIRSKAFGDIVETTTRDDCAAIWAADASTWAIEEQPDATPGERAIVDNLQAWLLANYDNGAHWIYETTESTRHVVELRAQSLETYMADLRRQWADVDAYADDIRNA